MRELPRTVATPRRWVPYVPALIPLGLTLGIVAALLYASGLHNFGWAFFGSALSEPQNTWGIEVFVVGSFITSVPALALAMLIGLGIAIASTTYLPRLVSAWLDPFVDLLAGIPSIVYGIWAYWIVRPYFGITIYPWAVEHLHYLPGFKATQLPLSPQPSGIGLPLAVSILFLMILPITTLLMRDALRSVPKDLWESGLALGATRWEVVRRIALPYSRRGIIAAAFLGFGRAIGETVAVAMVIGQTTNIPPNVYGTTATMASFIIGNIDSAFRDPRWLQFLTELGLVLMVITFTVNFLGRIVVRRTFADVAGI